MIKNFFHMGPDPREVSTTSAKTLHDDGQATFVDVREADEWVEGHIKGALHIPLGDLENRMSEIPTDKPIIAVCHSGVRSLTAVNILSAANQGTAKSMAGGVVEWVRRGYKLEH